MKKLFLLLCVWAALPIVAQTSDSKIPVIDVSYLKQGSSYGQYISAVMKTKILYYWQGLRATSVRKTKNSSLSPKRNSRRGSELMTLTAVL